MLLNPEPYVFKTEPFEHQRRVVDATWSDEYHALFCEMGTGKTKIVIDTVGMLYWNGLISAFVAIAPKSLMRTWLAELKTHLPEDIYRQAKIVRWMTGRKSAVAAAKELRKPSNGLRILVANCEALSTSNELLDVLDDILESGRTLVAADESTWLKKHDAKRTRAVLRIAPKATYRRLMTGTPVTKSPSDLYSQTEFLKAGVMGHRSYYSFRNQFSEMKTRFVAGRKITKEGEPRNLDVLKRRLDRFTTRLLKKDCLDLPPKIFLQEVVELTEEQQRAYDDMASMFFVSIKDLDPDYGLHYSTAQQAVTVMMKLHQICCGFLKADDGKVVRLKENRTALAMDILDRVDGSVVLWCAYRPSIEIMASELRLRYGADSVVEFHGGIDDAGRARAVEAFQAGDAPYFLGTLHAAARGLTLTRSSFSLYHSTTYDFELRAQSLDRIHRIGQTAESCTYLDILTEGTVEVGIHRVLANNQSLLSAVMESKVSELRSLIYGELK